MKNARWDPTRWTRRSHRALSAPWELTRRIRHSPRASNATQASITTKPERRRRNIVQSAQRGRSACRALLRASLALREHSARRALLAAKIAWWGPTRATQRSHRASNATQGSSVCWGLPPVDPGRWHPCVLDIGTGSLRAAHQFRPSCSTRAT